MRLINLSSNNNFSSEIFWERRDWNLGLLGEKQVCYLFATHYAGPLKYVIYVFVSDLCIRRLQQGVHVAVLPVVPQPVALGSANASVVQVRCHHIAGTLGLHTGKNKNFKLSVQLVTGVRVQCSLHGVKA